MIMSWYTDVGNLLNRMAGWIIVGIQWTLPSYCRANLPGVTCLYNYISGIQAMILPILSQPTKR